MSKVIVQDFGDGERLSFSFIINENEIEQLVLTPEEEAIIKATNSGASVIAVAQTVVMLLKKIEQQKVNRGFLSRDDERFDNLNELFVDHLVDRLESRSIGKILDFLARYCGWERIQKYVEKQIRERYIIK